MPALKRRPEPVPAGVHDAAVAVLTPYVARPGDVQQAASAVTEAMHLIYEMYLQDLRARLHEQLDHNKQLVRTNATLTRQMRDISIKCLRPTEECHYYRTTAEELSEETRRLHEELQRAVYSLDEHRARTRMWKERAKRAERRSSA